MTITKLFSSIIMLLLAAGCGTSTPVGDTPSESSGTDLTPQPLLVTNGTLTLVIFSPLDKAVVTESPVEILGSVSTDSTLTLQGETHILPPGDFSLLADLEPGLNELHFAVSSLLGNDVELTLVVNYEP
jgi:hypothetical protein